MPEAGRIGRRRHALQVVADILSAQCAPYDCNLRPCAVPDGGSCKDPAGNEAARPPSVATQHCKTVMDRAAHVIGRVRNDLIT
jgi:hypothetical protein